MRLMCHMRAMPSASEDVENAAAAQRSAKRARATSTRGGALRGCTRHAFRRDMPRQQQTTRRLHVLKCHAADR